MGSLPELCHGCGTCTLNGPEQAISERPDVVGVIEAGPTLAGLFFARGVMNVGEPMAVPIIRQLKKWHTIITSENSPALEQAISSAIPLVARVVSSTE